MADAHIAATLLERVDQLWPASTAVIPAMDQWLLEAVALHRRLSLHRTALAELASGIALIEDVLQVTRGALEASKGSGKDCVHAADRGAIA